MTNNLNIQKDYSKYPNVYQLRITSEMEIMIQADDSVRLLNEVLEGMDYTELYRAYSKEGRNPKTDPKTLFKMLVYGNMDGRYSSRDLEKACRRDVNYMWLLNGESAPNHNEIARFRSQRLPRAMENLFYQLVGKLSEAKEIKFEHLFVDGTKMEANANKYSFVWKKSTDRYQAKLTEKVKAMISELNTAYGYGFTEETDLSEIQDKLTKRKWDENINFVHGRGCRKTELQKHMELLTEYIIKQEKYRGYQEIFDGRNSFSKTDTDATFMHMKEDHMRNAQLKPGYNVQIAVEAEYIVGLDISSERSDQLTLIPLLMQMENNTGKQYKDVTADAGYESEENYSYFEEKKQDCYIKPQNYERSKTRKFKNDMNKRENMSYDIEKDEYTCENGKKLKATHTKKRKSKSGYTSEVTVYECENCEGCKYKDVCTKAKGNRKIQVSKKFITQREKSLKNIVSEKGILLRTNRSIQVEGAFGVIKQDYGFRQFLLRGKKKVFTEMLLMAFGFNVNKLHHKIQDERLGKYLFEKPAA